VHGYGQHGYDSFNVGTRGRQHRYCSFNVDACGQDSRFSYKGVFSLRTNLDGIWPSIDFWMEFSMLLFGWIDGQIVFLFHWTMYKSREAR
jgi:hypothetical protein